MTQQNGSTALATRPAPGALAQWSSQEVETIRDLICPGASDSELILFGKVCQRTGLDPFARQIYGLMRWDGRKKREVLSIQTSIDGFRLTAQRSGEYAGQSGPEWSSEDGAWREVWLEKAAPAAARVGVWRTGWTQPVWGVATFAEYCQRNKEGGPSGLWGRMPATMLAKCAEALALRKAFPAELSNLYTSDEMAQAGNATPAPEPATPDLRTLAIERCKELAALATESGYADAEKIASVDPSRLKSAALKEWVEKLEGMFPDAPESAPF